MSEREEQKYCEDIANLLLEIIKYYEANGYVALTEDIYKRLEESKTKLKTLKYVDATKLQMQVDINIVKYQFDIYRHFYFRDDEGLGSSIFMMKMAMRFVLDDMPWLH